MSMIVKHYWNGYPYYDGVYAVAMALGKIHGVEGDTLLGKTVLILGGGTGNYLFYRVPKFFQIIYSKSVI